MSGNLKICDDGKARAQELEEASIAAGYYTAFDPHNVIYHTRANFYIYLVLL